MGVFILLLAAAGYCGTGIAVDVALCKERQKEWGFDWIEMITWPKNL